MPGGSSVVRVWLARSDDRALGHGSPEPIRRRDEPGRHEPAVALAVHPDAVGIDIWARRSCLDGGQQVSRIHVSPPAAVHDRVGLAVALGAARVHEQDPESTLREPPRIELESLAERPVWTAVDLEHQRQCLVGRARGRMQQPGFEGLAIVGGELDALAAAECDPVLPAAVEVGQGPLGARLGVEQADLAGVVRAGTRDGDRPRGGSADREAVDPSPAAGDRLDRTVEAEPGERAGPSLEVGGVERAAVRRPTEVPWQERPRRIGSHAEADRAVKLGAELAHIAGRGGPPP